MHLYETKKKISFTRIIAIVILLFLLLFAVYSIGKSSSIAKNQEADLLYSAINKAVVSCYAIEGRYPESLQYITDHYGVIINEDIYLVDYEIFASNVKPSVHITVKGGSSGE